MQADRWPPIYDAEDLHEAIGALSSQANLQETFYARPEEGKTFQGDVVQLETNLPLIWEDGQPGINESVKFWLVLGNSCDFDRDISLVSVTQLVPIVQVDGSRVGTEEKRQFLTYTYSRRLYLPPWKTEISQDVHFADFTKPVTVHKNAIASHSITEASLSWKAWLLLHSCVVRFLARDDGRYDR